MSPVKYTCDICNENIKDRGGYCDVKGYSVKDDLDGKTIAGENCSWQVMCCQSCFDQIKKTDILNILENKYYINYEETSKKLQGPKPKQSESK